MRKLPTLIMRFQVAKLAGKYTTEDGYIFDPRDITSDEGDAYVTPHMTHSHWIKKDSLSEAERAAAQAYAKERFDPSFDRPSGFRKYGG